MRLTPPVSPSVSSSSAAPRGQSAVDHATVTAQQLQSIPCPNLRTLVNEGWLTPDKNGLVQLDQEPFHVTAARSLQLADGCRHVVRRGGAHVGAARPHVHAQRAHAEGSVRRHGGRHGGRWAGDGEGVAWFIINHLGLLKPAIKAVG